MEIYLYAPNFGPGSTFTKGIQILFGTPLYAANLLRGRCLGSALGLLFLFRILVRIIFQLDSRSAKQISFGLPGYAATLVRGLRLGC